MLKELIVRFDSRLTIAITGWPKWLQVPMLVVTFIGQPVSVILLAALVAWFNISNIHIVVALATSVGAMLINTMAKHFIHRPRPDTLYVNKMYFKSSSFPSGHAFGGVAVLGMVAYLAATYGMPGLTVLLVLLIASIGTSRVYLGAHYPTDVLAGWALGSAFLILIIGVINP